MLPCFSFYDSHIENLHIPTRLSIILMNWQCWLEPWLQVFIVCLLDSFNVIGPTLIKKYGSVFWMIKKYILKSLVFFFNRINITFKQNLYEYIIIASISCCPIRIRIRIPPPPPPDPPKLKNVVPDQIQ